PVQSPSKSARFLAGKSIGYEWRQKLDPGARKLARELFLGRSRARGGQPSIEILCPPGCGEMPRIGIKCQMVARSTPSSGRFRSTERRDFGACHGKSCVNA